MLDVFNNGGNVMSYNNLELGDPKKAIKKASRLARKKIIPIMKNLVASGQLNSNEMKEASSDLIRTYSSNCIVQLNAISRKYI